MLRLKRVKWFVRFALLALVVVSSSLISVKQPLEASSVPQNGYAVPRIFNSAANLCVEYNENGVAEGSAVYAFDCISDQLSHTSPNRWKFVGVRNARDGYGVVGQLQATGLASKLCLSVPMPSTLIANGVNLILSRCASTERDVQLWRSLPNGGVGFGDTEFCLDLETGEWKNGSPIQIWRCEFSGPNRLPQQTWQVMLPTAGSSSQICTTTPQNSFTKVVLITPGDPILKIFWNPVCNYRKLSISAFRVGKGKTKTVSRCGENFSRLKTAKVSYSQFSRGVVSGADPNFAGWRYATLNFQKDWKDTKGFNVLVALDFEYERSMVVRGRKVVSSVSVSHCAETVLLPDQQAQIAKCVRSAAKWKAFSFFVDNAQRALSIATAFRNPNAKGLKVLDKFPSINQFISSKDGQRLLAGTTDLTVSTIVNSEATGRENIRVLLTIASTVNPDGPTVLVSTQLGALMDATALVGDINSWLSGEPGLDIYKDCSDAVT
jgi:hypothetical protein